MDKNKRTCIDACYERHEWIISDPDLDPPDPYNLLITLIAEPSSHLNICAS